MTERKNVKNVKQFEGHLLLLLLLVLLFPKNEKKMVRKRRGLGEQKKTENPFVAVKMKPMKMVGPLYDAKFKT